MLQRRGLGAGDELDGPSGKAFAPKVIQGGGQGFKSSVHLLLVQHLIG